MLSRAAVLGSNDARFGASYSHNVPTSGHKAKAIKGVQEKKTVDQFHSLSFFLEAPLPGAVFGRAV